MGRPSIVATLALAVLATRAAAGEGPAPGPSPERPAAVVHGRPLSRASVLEELARRRFRGEDGDRLREQFLSDAAARREQARRGVAVTEEEIAAAVEDARRRTAEQMARYGEKVTGADPLDRFLKESGFTLEEFVAHTRQYLALQKMAREDLGAKGEVPNAQIEVWLRDLLRRSGATTDPAVLGPGEVARLGGEPLDWVDAGRWLSRNVRRHDLLGVVYDLAFGIAVEERASKEGVSLPPAEVDAEIDRLRREFQRQPGIEGTGVTFDAWLRDRQGLSPEELRRDPAFRALLLARKMAGAGVTPEAVRGEWEAHPERYGETARIRRIVIHGEEKASVFGAAARPMAEARRIADRALEEIRGGKEFDVVARKYSEDTPVEEARGQPLDLSPAPGNTAVAQPVIEAVFAAKEGDLLGPVRAADGWHVVRVEKRTPAPTFEQCAPRVRDDLVARAVRDWKIALRTDPGVRVAEDL